MIVTHLRMENFMGYRKPCDLDFTGKKIIGICGSNEAGKSSILQAISYALYGNTRASREVDLIHDHGTGDMVVEIGLAFRDGSTLEITRGRTRDNKPILKSSITSAIAKPTQVAEAVAEKLRLDFEDFQGLFYFQQGDIHQFMNGDKRSYFKRWTRSLEIWSRFEAEAKARLKDFQIELQSWEIKREQALKIRNQESTIRTRALQMESDLAACEMLVQAQRELVAELKAAIKFEQDAGEIEHDLSDAQLRLDGLRRRLHRIDNSIRKTKKSIKDLANHKCPVLSIKCDFLKEANADELQEDNDQLEEATNEKAECESEITQLEFTIESAMARLKVAKEKDNLKDLRVAETQMEDLQTQVQEIRASNAKAQAALKLMEKAKADVKEAKVKIAEANKEISLWSFVQFMCGSGGVPAFIVEGELQRVEDRCNWVLERLDYAKRIKFQAYRELAAYEKVCPVCGGSNWSSKTCTGCGAPRPKKRKDEPTVMIWDGSKQRPFEMESGGAQVLQSFAVRLACSLFMSSMQGMPFEMVMLDEVFAMLDAGNRQKLMCLVIDKLGSEFGLRQQFVVSHHEDVVNSVDDILFIRKENGSSVASWS